MPRANRLSPFNLQVVLNSAAGSVGGRWLQDSPILIDVWRALDNGFVDVLMTPVTGIPAQALAEALRRREVISGKFARLAYNESYAVVRLTLRQLVLAALPLAHGWLDRLQRWPSDEEAANKLRTLFSSRRSEIPQDDLQLYWVAQVVGLLQMDEDDRAVFELADDDVLEKAEAKFEQDFGWIPSLDELVQASEAEGFMRVAAKFGRMIEPLLQPQLSEESASRVMSPVDLRRRYPLERVSINRIATTACVRSTLTVKADAGRRLFNISSDKITWGVVDCGIDHLHPAFLKRNAAGMPIRAPDGGIISRVVARYDFCKLRRLIEGGGYEAVGNGTLQNPTVFDVRARAAAAKAAKVERDVRIGRVIDWAKYEPLLRYEGCPAKPHGTHVAGILAGDFCIADAAGVVTRAAEYDDDGSSGFMGMCPQLNLYDLRVFDDEGASDEFTILCALQFVRFLNRSGDVPAIHGLNMSLSLQHDVTSFACGATPICEECERLINAGTVVVAAAGNSGFDKLAGGRSDGDDYRVVSITDPGNAPSVITVGATHRWAPHRYGVSYFSSRGPTGDGRLKPDLVAPGEKIVSAQPITGSPGAVPLLVQDGTSMAAPHVSGAAALLMARYDELIGQPARIKRILCDTATDLGRTRDFQGAGLLDVLRALQSI